MCNLHVSTLQTPTSQPAATLLLAESDPDNLHMLAKALANKGYQVIKVINGHQLLSSIERFVPDAILIDSQLDDGLQSDSSATTVSVMADRPLAHTPKQECFKPPLTAQLDGYTFCHILSQELTTMHIPVIMMNETDTLEARLRSLQANAWHYVQKPLQIEELHLQIQTLLQRVAQDNGLLQESRQWEEIAAQRAEKLKIEQEMRRREEERVSHLLEIIQSQNQQLQFLMSLILEASAEQEENADGRVPTRHEQTAILRYYFDQLTDLAMSFLGDSDSRSSFTRHVPTGDTKHSRAETQKLNAPSVFQQKHRPKRQPPSTSANNHRQPSQLNQLSAREYDILVYLAEGESYQMIAKNLHIAPSTVRSYRSRIMQKLGLANSTEMIKLAVRQGLIKIH